MKLVHFFFVVALPLLASLTNVSVYSQSLNNYKYVVIQHQEDSKADIEERMEKEFPILGFSLITNEEVSRLDNQEKDLVLTAEYFCRQSIQCVFKIKLKNSKGNIVYEDEQVSAAGFMTKKNDRQSAIKKIFKQLKKMNYQYSPK